MVSRAYGVAVHLMWPEEEVEYRTRLGCGLFARDMGERVTTEIKEVTCKKCSISQRMRLALAKSV
jgi:Zn ribbon nucleic-acid-binding protein